jgi:NAD(P)-dependent dehydrogenase (short-subunit alcohol dehydrogenase family)
MYPDGHRRERRHRAQVATGGNEMRKLDLTGKVALISGATGHLGSALSLAFGEAGAKLVLNGRNQERLEALADSIEAAIGRQPASVAADISTPEGADHLAQAAWNAFGKIDIVVCNAAPTLADIETGVALETSDEDWQRMQNVIVWGPLRLLRGVLPKMMAGDGGSILTVCSSSGNSPVPGIDAYGMAKGGLQLLTKYLARECGSAGVRVNAIMPAGVVTDPAEEARIRKVMTENGLLSQVSLGRLGRTEDIVGPALFLVSDHAAYITGQVLNADGGRI